jgi:enoyl-CoA hydratase/carnithine racemase
MRRRKPQSNIQTRGCCPHGLNEAASGEARFHITSEKPRLVEMTSPQAPDEAATEQNKSTWEHFRLDRRSESYWRVTFDHPPINTITATTVTELSELINLIEAASRLNVVVFDSANPEFFMAHYDTEKAPERSAALPKGPTGLNAWLDFLVRLSRAPVATIAMIRGRTRGGGSEFVLACDMRFASRENALLGQFEVAQGLVPGGGAMARLSRLAGRGRALEIVLVGNDCDGPTAELYGYVNRAVPDAELDGVVEEIAARLAGFEHEAIARAKRQIDAVTLPDNSEYPPALDDFFELSAQPREKALLTRLEDLGLNTNSDLERRLPERVAELGREMAASS